MLDLGGFRSGGTAVVLGAGSIGLMLVQWLRIAGARLIVATDLIAENREAALALGAQVTLDPARVDVPAEVARLTEGGADLVFEATGSPIALGQTIDVARPRAAIVLGGNQPLDASLPMAFVEGLMRKELTLAGCFMSYSAPWPGHEWTDGLASRSSTAGSTWAGMIFHRVPLSEAPELVAEIAADRLTHRKIVFDPSS